MEVANNKWLNLAGYTIAYPIFMLGAPVAWMWSMFSDFGAHSYLWMACDLFIPPIGAIRGLGFWFGWWTP